MKTQTNLRSAATTAISAGAAYYYPCAVETD